MAVQHKYTIVCEYARQEFGGKWTLIGIFPNGISTPQVPFPLPMLTFFQEFYSSSSGIMKFRGKLSQLDNGAVLAEVPPIQIQIAPGPIIIPIGLGNLQFLAFGSYMWSMEIDGEQDPVLTEFQVRHVPQQMPFPMPKWKP